MAGDADRLKFDVDVTVARLLSLKPVQPVHAHIDDPALSQPPLADSASVEFGLLPPRPHLAEHGCIFGDFESIYAVKACRLALQIFVPHVLDQLLLKRGVPVALVGVDAEDASKQAPEHELKGSSADECAGEGVSVVVRIFREAHHLRDCFHFPCSGQFSHGFALRVVGALAEGNFVTTWQVNLRAVLGDFGIGPLALSALLLTCHRFSLRAREHWHTAADSLHGLLPGWQVT